MQQKLYYLYFVSSLLNINFTEVAFVVFNKCVKEYDDYNQVLMLEFLDDTYIKFDEENHIRIKKNR